MERVPGVCRDRSIPWTAIPAARPRQHCQAAARFSSPPLSAGGRQHAAHPARGGAVPVGAPAVESGEVENSEGIVAVVPGLHSDMSHIDRAEVSQRIEQIRDERLLPEAAIIWLGKLLREAQQRLWRIELTIEQLIIKVPNMPSEMLADVCEILCPELYGEPPAPPRASHALPKSRARLAALQRRHQALHGLWHRDDSFVDSVTSRQQELFLYSEIIEASHPIPRTDSNIIRITRLDIG
jgi:hypothetical protein